MFLLFSRELQQQQQRTMLLQEAQRRRQSNAEAWNKADFRKSFWAKMHSNTWSECLVTAAVRIVLAATPTCQPPRHQIYWLQNQENVRIQRTI